MLMLHEVMEHYGNIVRAAWAYRQAYACIEGSECTQPPAGMKEKVAQAHAHLLEVIDAARAAGVMISSGAGASAVG